MFVLQDNRFYVFILFYFVSLYLKRNRHFICFFFLISISVIFETSIYHPTLVRG